MRNNKEERNKTQKGPGSQKAKKQHGSALNAASHARSATEQASHHSGSDLANTGTNISYEGATAPGAGGSAGTGYTSGKEGTGEKIRTDSDYDQARVQKPLKKGDKKPR